MVEKSIEKEKKFIDSAPIHEKETVRIYGDADKAAAEQLYFTLLKEKI